MITEMISQDFLKQSKYGFYKFPKSLITDQRISGISNDAKILYMLFIDRLTLSKINGWIDKYGEVYIYYSVKNICKDLHCLVMILDHILCLLAVVVVSDKA